MQGQGGTQISMLSMFTQREVAETCNKIAKGVYSLQQVMQIVQAAQRFTLANFLKANNYGYKKKAINANSSSRKIGDNYK